MQRTHAITPILRINPGFRPDLSTPNINMQSQFVRIPLCEFSLTVSTHSPAMNQQKRKVDVSEFQTAQTRLSGLVGSSLF